MSNANRIVLRNCWKKSNNESLKRSITWKHFIALLRISVKEKS